MIRVNTIRTSMFSIGMLAAILTPQASADASEAYSGLVARHAAAHGLPPALVHRVIMRESRYNPRAVSKGNYGMMQIRLGTARAMGYTGSAAGLLDPNTNMTYAVKYLAGAYRAAGGNADRAVALYASGYGGRARSVQTYAGIATSVAAEGPSMGPLPAISREARRARGEYGRVRRGESAAQANLRRHGID
jgi:soluble lytic murein transglycosylase-like protein